MMTSPPSSPLTTLLHSLTHALVSHAVHKHTAYVHIPRAPHRRQNQGDDEFRSIQCNPHTHAHKAKRVYLCDHKCVQVVHAPLRDGVTAVDDLGQDMRVNSST